MSSISKTSYVLILGFQLSSSILSADTSSTSVEFNEAIVRSSVSSALGRTVSDFRLRPSGVLVNPAFGPVQTEPKSMADTNDTYDGNANNRNKINSIFIEADAHLEATKEAIDIAQIKSQDEQLNYVAQNIGKPIGAFESTNFCFGDKSFRLGLVQANFADVIAYYDDEGSGLLNIKGQIVKAMDIVFAYTKRISNNLTTGIDLRYLYRDILSKTSTITDPEITQWQHLNGFVTTQEIAVDFGIAYQIENLALNLGLKSIGTTQVKPKFEKEGSASPQEITIGSDYSFYPQVESSKVKFAIDYLPLGSQNNLSAENCIRLGMETTINNLALRFGLNDGYLSQGFGFFGKYHSLDFTHSSSELTHFDGLRPDERYSITYRWLR